MLTLLSVCWMVKAYKFVPKMSYCKKITIFFSFPVEHSSDLSNRSAQLKDGKIGKQQARLCPGVKFLSDTDSKCRYYIKQYTAELGKSDPELFITPNVFFTSLLMAFLAVGLSLHSE